MIESIKKDDILPFVTAWMDLDDFMLVKQARWRKTIAYDMGNATGVGNTKKN